MEGLSFKTHTLGNARDLGGIAAEGGVVASGKLIRTSALGDAARSEVSQLESHYHPAYVMDLRASAEAAKIPDPMQLLGKAQYVNIPLADDKDVGVVRQGGIKETLQLLRTMINDPVGMLSSMYVDIVSSKRGQDALRLIFDTFLEADGGCVVWHCTAGKDRAGIVAALMLLALGASRESVYEDYLLTNKHMEPYLKKQKRQFRFLPKKLKASLGVMNEANPVFLDAALNAIDEQFGGIDSYLEKQLDLTPEKREMLKRLYVI